jgi:hypothetical protein
MLGMLTQRQGRSAVRQVSADHRNFRLTCGQDGGDKQRRRPYPLELRCGPERLQGQVLLMPGIWNRYSRSEPFF